ncbi:hypothetical protein [Microbacterium binotii]|uniref:DUF2244 domain-containing protein n=1 Tax=Microbacterium binotii TaxID=462710 RepID=A0ABN3P6S2_9MICO
MNAAPTMTLRDQREVFALATAPSHAERLLLLGACALIAAAVALSVVGIVAAEGWLLLAATVAFGAVGFLWERRAEMRRGRLRLRPAIERNRPAAVRLALYVLQPQFEDIEVLADSEVIEVLADPFTLNAAERDFEFEARLDDARVRYERVDEYTAHLRDQHSMRGLGAAPAAK